MYSHAIFAQPFLHRVQPKTRGPERGSRSALIVVAHIFSWPPVRLRHVRGGVGKTGVPDHLVFRTSCNEVKSAESPLEKSRSLVLTKKSGLPTLRSPVPASLPLLALQLRPNLSGLRVLEYSLFTPSLSVFNPGDATGTQGIGV